MVWLGLGKKMRCNLLELSLFWWQVQQLTHMTFISPNVSNHKLNFFVIGPQTYAKYGKNGWDNFDLQNISTFKKPLLTSHVVFTSVSTIK